MANNFAKLAINAYNLIDILTYISCGLLVLSLILLFLQKFDKYKFRSIIKYLIAPMILLTILIILLTCLSVGFYLGVSYAFSSVYNEPVMYVVQEVNKDNIIVKSNDGVKKVDYKDAKKLSKKQGFKKGQEIDLGTRELSKNTPKNVIKLLNKFPY